MPDGPSNWPSVPDACAAAAGAFDDLRAMSPGDRAAMLESLAAALDARCAEIIALAADETALYPSELEPEFDRMTGTLRLFAGVVREGSWVRAAIDRPAVPPAKSVGPNHDVRSMLVPLGPIAVFGASNFPLAYGVYGGDTASALAAGCPVVVKEHPAHPRLGRLFAKIAHEVAPSMVGYVLDNATDAGNVVARELVGDTAIAGVGFTGSVQGGRALDALARQRSIPVPVFAEMGSHNLVIISRRAIAERGIWIIDELADSILARHGQQCTRAGVVVLDRAGASRVERTPDPLIDRLRERLLAGPARRMLSPRVSAEYRARMDDIADWYDSQAQVYSAAVTPDEPVTAPALVHTDASELPTNGPRFLDEVFGPACMVLHVDVADSRFAEIFDGLNADKSWGCLVATVHLSSAPDELEQALVERLLKHVGRLVFNGPPTGVRVAHGMVHGGPWPATNRPDTTAVGPRAIERWCRPVCWQNCPQELLPPELQDSNPRGIWRMVDGEWTKAAKS